MCTITSLPTYDNNGVDQTHRKNVFHHKSGSLRKNSKQTSAESSNSGNEPDKLLSRESFSVSRGESRTDVVEREAIFAKWEVPKNWNARNDNSDRCIKKERESLFTDHNTSMANASVLHDIVVNVGDTSNSVIQTQNILMQSPRPHSSLSSKRTATVSSFEGFKRTLTSEEILGFAAKLIKDSRRQGSVSIYQSAWEKWSCWCSERKTHPFASALRDVLNVLAHLYENKYEYSSINGHRSATSAYRVPVNGNPSGQHLRACALTTRILNSRPSKPRFCFA